MLFMKIEKDIEHFISDSRSQETASISANKVKGMFSLSYSH